MSSNNQSSNSGSTGTKSLTPHLLDKEATIPFLGLTADSVLEYPEEVDTEGERFSEDAAPFEDVIEVLPKPMAVDVWADNPFVDESGEVDVEAIRDVHGLDTDTLENAMGESLETVVEDTDPTPLEEDRHRKAIVDPRRLALNALGYDTRFRWQIASNRYTAGDPQDFLRPAIDAFRRRGMDGFGWLSFDNWGGHVKLTMIWPSVNTDFDTGPTSDLTAYMGYRIQWDVQGTQKIKAHEVVFLPELQVSIPDIGQVYSRKHLGQFIDPEHERQNDRLPPRKWHGQIASTANQRVVTVPENILRLRETDLDLTQVPYAPIDDDADEMSKQAAINTLTTFYLLHGIPETYAEEAAAESVRMAEPHYQPTLFAIVLNLQRTLLEVYEDHSLASDQYVEYQELASDIYDRPFQMIQLAAREYEIQRTDEDEEWIPENQLGLVDDPESANEIPGVNVTNERALTDVEATQLENRVQQKVQETLGGFSSA